MLITIQPPLPCAAVFDFAADGSPLLCGELASHALAASLGHHVLEVTPRCLQHADALLRANTEEELLKLRREQQAEDGPMTAARAPTCASLFRPYRPFRPAQPLRLSSSFAGCAVGEHSVAYT